MRNLHKINILPEPIRLAAMYWENYRLTQAGEYKDDFRIGWSPTHPDWIFWDHYLCDSADGWGFEKASDRIKNLIPPQEDINFEIVNMDELYPGEVRNRSSNKNE